MLAPACTTHNYPPGREGVQEVELLDTESEAIDSEDLLDGLATTPPSSFLGLFVTYEAFDEDVLARDLERIERYYRARGYYEAKVVAARIIPYEDTRVIVQIKVQQGTPVVTRSVRVTGIELLPFRVATAALTSVKLRDGEPFDEEGFEATKQALADVLADEGYAFVEVEGKAKVDISRHAADAEFQVKPGRLAQYGDVTIFGLEEIPEGPVRGNLLIKKGDQYSRSDLVEARSALVALGVFSTVEVREDKSQKEPGVVPINVVVQESALRTVRLGGGASFDVLRLENHLRVGWEDRNFLGGMRQFSIDTRPGLTYFPTRIDELVAPTRLLVENKIRTELRQPAFIEGRTTGFVVGEYNIYPLLYPLPEDTNPDDERIIGYHEFKVQTGVERAFFNQHLYVTPSLNWQANIPFIYQCPATGDPDNCEPEGLDTVQVQFPELFVALDLRDDPIHPNRGIYLSNDLQVAGFWGDVSDVRVRPEARIYLPLHRYNRRWTLALRGTLGFLFPRNYGDTLNPETVEGQVVPRDPTQPDVIRDQHKLLFRAFYSGGPTSNRGYAFRDVGPHGPIGFLVPTGADCRYDPNLPGSLEALPDTCIRPLGGVTLWEASFEVRFPITTSLSGATFVDASDVTRTVAEIGFEFPHISIGPGLRYETPVGPLRLDIGYRVPGLQRLAERDDEEEPEPLSLFGLELPIAIHLAFGEAF
jgi:outer membrane protein insertion porin family/translocation and assembly module TamA